MVPEALSACAIAAMRSIQANGLQVDPQSFSVWYQYHQGTNPELRRLIDIILSNRTNVGREAIARIYDRFVANPSDHQDLRAIAERMQQTLAQVQSLVRDAGADASRFGAAVTKAAAQMAAPDTALAALLDSLVAEAQGVAARASRIERELTRNGEMILTMQRTLHDARTAAITDPLTGLANRRHMDESLQVLAGTAMNDGRWLSLLMVDIDHFKRINDKWGHPVGDQVIQLAAATIRGSLRDNDLAARYGGEEFAVLLPGVTTDDAVMVGERIREAFARHQMVVRNSGEVLGQMTVSVGVAQYEPGEPLTGWMARADAALYEAKGAGRNRVVTARRTDAAA